MVVVDVVGGVSVARRCSRHHCCSYHLQYRWLCHCCLIAVFNLNYFGNFFFFILRHVKEKKKFETRERKKKSRDPNMFNQCTALLVRWWKCSPRKRRKMRRISYTRSTTAIPTSYQTLCRTTEGLLLFFFDP